MKTSRTALLWLFSCTTSVLADKPDPVTVTADTPKPTDEPSYSDGNTFKSAVLNTTNQYREEHSSPPLTWNETLASFAKRHATKCEFEHSGGPYGENLAIGYPNASSAIAAWGDEREDYNYGKAKFKKETGHFTQLVWNSTEEVGCGRKLCSSDGDEGDEGEDRGWIVVCEYWPVGNVQGEFEDEVAEEEEESKGESRIRGRNDAWKIVLGMVCTWALVGGVVWVG